MRQQARRRPNFLPLPIGKRGGGMGQKECINGKMISGLQFFVIFLISSDRRLLPGLRQNAAAPKRKTTRGGKCPPLC